jgi:hypothetical protein
MTEAVLPDALNPRAVALQWLRDQGAGQHLPLQLRYLELLAQRLASGCARGETGKVLAHRLDQALADARQQLEQAVRRAQDKGSSPVAPTHRLAELNRYIQSLNPVDVSGSSGSAVALAHPLKSVAQFQDTWSRLRAQERVDEALAHCPENAGPFNSQLLMLRTLALMRELSPQYLHHFLAQADSLLWLDEVSRGRKVAPSKPARRRRG